MSQSPTPSAELSPTLHFLHLPLEIRQHIYTYLLPHTSTLSPLQQTHQARNARRQDMRYAAYDYPKAASPPSHKLNKYHNITWHRGTTAILAVNHQLHSECADIMYGSNVFVIDVGYSEIAFRYRWVQRESNLTPNRRFALLEHFSARNLRRIRHWIVNVEDVDSYTGMVKYNCGGNGLPFGLRKQVTALVTAMSDVPHHLQRLQIHFSSGNRTAYTYPIRTAAATNTQTVLEPFGSLRGVRAVAVEGMVTDEYAQGLKIRMC